MSLADSAAPLINRRFLVLDAIGRGGMGRVFRAYDRDRERIVALKTPHDPRRAGPDHPMTDEFRMGSRLDHPNVVRILDLDRAREGPLAPDSPFLVLERSSGRPAHHALPAGRCGPRTLRTFAREVLLGLDHVHEAGVVHRDLKPGNLLVSGAGPRNLRVQLTDFGLATDVGTRDEPGRISGSLPYLAPESIVGAPVDARTDLYGLGVLLHYLSTGRMPFPEDPEAILHWHLEGPPADPGRHVPSLPPDWSALVRAMTSRHPDSRPPSAADALRRLGFEPTDPGRDDRTGRARAATAILRLAVDAVRLGGIRIHGVAPPSFAARAREARTLARIHDLGFHRIDVPGGAGTGLGRVVADLVGGQSDRARDVLERHGLTERFPLQILGGVALWDRSSLDPSRLPAPERRAIARGVAGVLLGAAVRRPLLLSFSAAAIRDPLNATVVARLAAHAARCPAPQPGAPGLLILRPAGFGASPRGAGLRGR